jgi:hypothetical protein
MATSITITYTQNVINEETGAKILTSLEDFFKTSILKKIAGYERPLVQKYRNFLERSLGRFECYFDKTLEQQIMDYLLLNPQFKDIHNYCIDCIKKHNDGCIEDICFIPVEANTPDGVWHRDTIIENEIADFERPLYYIGHLIYFDNLANTEFCLNSEHNSNNNADIYEKRMINTETYSSVYFDGRILHRGLKNNSAYTRYAIYISYITTSYSVKETQNIYF